MRELDSDYAWTDTNSLLSAIEYRLRVLPIILFGKKEKAERLLKSEKPIAPKNRSDLKREEEQRRKEKLFVDGMEIMPTTREQLKEMFNH